MRYLIALTAALLVIGQASADLYDPPANYYNSATGTGTTLKNQLHNIIDDHTFLFYSQARSALQVTDRDPNDPDNIILAYDRTSLDVSGLFASGIPGWDSGQSWNREHVWPRSRGINDDLGDDNSDLHNLRPADPQVNSDRSNLNFGGAFGQAFGTVSDGGTFWYPGDADAGMVARQSFYMAVRYDGSDSLTTNLELSNGNPGSFGTTLGNLSRLVEWHFAAPPDDFERRRNDVIFDDYQGNRNPFIDRPEYAWSVFVDQANDSRITIVGGTPGADPSQTNRTLDFGVVLEGSLTPLSDQQVTLDKAGNDGAYYEVSAANGATSSIGGRLNTFRSSGTDSETITVGFSADATTAGIKTGTVTIDNLDVTTGGGTGRGGNDLDDVITTQLTVLAHSNGSFDPVNDENTLTLDFGQVTVGSTAAPLSFDLHNLESVAGLTANLVVGSSSLIFGDTELSFFINGQVLPGSSAQGQAFINTAAVGSYESIWLLQVSDPALPGALTEELFISLTGEVIEAALPGDLSGDGDVDDEDLGLFFSTFTGPDMGPPDNPAADLSGDNDVDDEDLGLAFGAFTGPLAPANVPEPASAALVALLLAGCLNARGRRH